MPSKSSKKTFTDSDGAVERFFINSRKEQDQTQAQTQTETQTETETEPRTETQTETRTESAAAMPVWIDSPTEEDLVQTQTQPTQKTPVMPPTQDSYDAQQTQMPVEPQAQTQIPVEPQAQTQTPIGPQVQPPIPMQPQTQLQDAPIISTPAAGERGLRKERIGLLLDGQLKEDLAHLSKATGSKSLNDFLVTMLTTYAESPESREKLAQYRRLLQD